MKFNPSMFIVMMAMKTGQKIATKVATIDDWKKKMLMSALIDIGDFVVGAGDLVLPFDIPVASLGGTAYDIITFPIAVALWGEYGLMSALEIPMGTELGNGVDAFIPIVSMSGMLAKKEYK